jgi:hypothetical protein
MASTTNAGATPAVEGATPSQQPPADGSPANGTQPATGATEGDEALGEGGKSALEKERAAAREATKRAEKAERDLKVLQDASLSEQERRDKRLSELEGEKTAWETERQDWQTREAVTVTALRLGYADPADAYSLIDRSALEFDDNGKPRNVDKLLSDLIAAKPYLAGSSRPGGSFDGGPRGAPATGVNMNDMLRRAAGRTG